jgi:predicted PurR-regulated permease PerM
LWQIAGVRDIFFILLTFAALCFVYWLRGILLPIFAAFVLAYLCNPVVSLMRSKWRWPRPITTAVIILSVLAALVGFFSWLGPLLFEQTMLLAHKLPDYVKTLAARYNFDIGDFGDRIQGWMGLLQAEPQQIMGHLFNSTSRAVGIVTFLLGAATHWLLSIFLILL